MHKVLAAGNTLTAHLGDATADQPLQRVLNQRHTDEWQQHLWSLYRKRAEALLGVTYTKIQCACGTQWHGIHKLNKKLFGCGEHSSPV